MTRLIESAFHLSLGDGSGWQFAADQPNLWLIDKLAAIMELDKCKYSGLPKLFFCKNGYTSRAIEEAVRAVPSKSLSLAHSDSWYCYDHKTLRTWVHNDIPDVVCEVKENKGSKIQFLNLWYSLQPIYQRSIGKAGLPLHAGLVELDGQGVILAASGDTGKSTCCSRLPAYWNPLCDDEVLVILDKQKKYRAHPFPTWSDYLWKHSRKTWDVQYSVPLSGIFFLEQSWIDEVVPLGGGRAAVLLSESASQICQKFWRIADRKEQRQFRKKLFNNACEMAKQIPTYRLRVSLRGKFWEKIEKVLDR